PRGEAGDPAQHHASGPQPVTQPSARGCELRQARHFRQRVESDPQDESPDPTEDLRVSMRLEPRWRETLQIVTVADRYQVPNTQQSTWKEHEEKPGQDEHDQQPLKPRLTGCAGCDVEIPRKNCARRGHKQLPTALV